MATPYSDTNSDDLSNALYNNLTSGVSIAIPSIDLNDPIYDISSFEDNPLYSTVDKLSIDELTTREVCGSGVFDALMEAYSKHLLVEFEKNRITGTEYAQAYVSITSQAMGQAIQFLMGKDQAYWSALLVQAQAKAAEIASISSRVELAKAKMDFAMAAIGVDKFKAEFALTKMQLASEDVKYDLVKTQDQIEEYRLSNLMPVELAQLQEQTQILIAQRLTIDRERDKLGYEITTLMPDQHTLNLAQIDFQEKQAEKIDAEILAVTFDVEQMLPTQKLQIEAQTAQITAETAKAGYELSTILPDQHNLAIQQIAKSTKEVEAITFDITEIKPVELANLQAQTATLGHQNTKLLYEIATLLPDEHQKNLKDIDLADNQILKTTKDIEMLDFQISDILPAELTKLTAEVAQIGMQTNKISADRDNVVYATNFLNPSQRENVIADTTAKQYTATQVLPAQVRNTESDTLIKEYTRTQIMPAQLTLTRESAEAKRAETLNSRSDGTTVAGSIGKQKDVYTQQIESYKRDSEYKIGKLVTDAWITQKGINESVAVPNNLQNPSIDTILTRLKTRNELT